MTFNEACKQVNIAFIELELEYVKVGDGRNAEHVRNLLYDFNDDMRSVRVFVREDRIDFHARYVMGIDWCRKCGGDK